MASSLRSDSTMRMAQKRGLWMPAPLAFDSQAKKRSNCPSRSEWPSSFLRSLGG